MSLRARLTGLLTLAALAVALPARPAAQESAADALFDDRMVHPIRISINSRDLALLREHFQDNTFYPADLQWRDVRVRNVGIRSRGLGSRSAQKIGLLVEFDHYTPGQRFMGLSSLVLDNLFQDPTLLREPLAMSFLRRLGQPAPREAFAQLLINNAYEGLFAMVEPIDPAFALRTLGDGNGHLFEYHYLHPFYAEDPGDDLALYRALFEPQNHKSDPDDQLFGPIRDLFREVNAVDEDVWEERVGVHLDLPELMRYVATEAFLCENDGFLGYAGMNNFYLHRLSGTSRHQVLAWDKDFAFTFVECSIFNAVNDNVLVRRSLEREALRTLYLDAAEAAAISAVEGGWLAGEIERLSALILPYVLKDRRKQYSNQEFLDGVEFLRTFAATRPAHVLEQVAAAR
jgi:spore coat protein CotH